MVMATTMHACWEGSLAYLVIGTRVCAAPGKHHTEALLDIAKDGPQVLESQYQCNKYTSSHPHQIACKYSSSLQLPHMLKAT